MRGSPRRGFGCRRLRTTREDMDYVGELPNTWQIEPRVLDDKYEAQDLLTRWPDIVS